MSAVAFSISQCFTEVKSKLFYSSIFAKSIVSKEGTISHSNDSESSHGTGNNAANNLRGEIIIRPFRNSDTDRVRELFLDSIIGR